MSSSPSGSPHQDFIADVIDHGDASRQQILVIGLCMLLNMIDGFDITAMSVVAGAVTEELDLTPDRLGLIFSSALAGMMAGAMFVAPVSDLIGRRKTIVLSAAAVAGSILLTARATTLTEFLVLRFVSGLGGGAILACQAALAAEYSPERYRSLSIAVATAGYPMGAMMTSVVATYMMPAFGWRGMFWLGGAVTLFLGAVAWLLLPESLKYLVARRPAGALERVNEILRKLKKDTIEALPPREEEPTARRGGVAGNVASLLSREHRLTTVRLWTSFFLCFTALYFLMSWIPRLLETSGFSAETGRLGFFLFNLGGVIGIFTLGLLSTRWHLTKLVFGSLVAASVGMVVFASVPDQLAVMMTLILLIGILQQGGFTGLYAVAGKVYPTEIRSTGIGWAIGLGRSGAVIGPAVAGFLIAAGLGMSANYYIFAIPLVVSGLLAFTLRVK